MIRSLRTGVSGLLSHQNRLDVVSNNISNANTVAFKRSRVAFSEMLAQELTGIGRSGSENSNAAYIGNGVAVSSIDKNWQQGSYEFTDIRTDLALNGDGFFLADKDGRNVLTRAGNFTFNDSGQLVTAGGLALQGYGVDANGDGLLDLGRTKAFVWYVRGNVSLKNVEVTGNVVFYADAYRTMNGAVSGGIGLDRRVVGQLNADNETTTMLRTPGGIDVYGNDEILASIWANQQVTFHGTPDMTGNILSPDARFEGNGNFTMTYAAPSSIITDPGFQNISPVGPVLIGYAEWDEQTLF